MQYHLKLGEIIGESIIKHLRNIMIKQMKLFEDEEKQKRIQNQIDSLQYELNYDTRDYPH